MTHHPERSRRRRRDHGLNQVTVWTRRAVGFGVVLSGTLAAGLAHLLPGQAADRPPSAPATSQQPSDHATPPTTPGTPTPASSGSSGTASPRPHRSHHHHLSPPTTAPAAPSNPSPTHTTSGGS
jgi:hypothetical protein